MGFEKGLLKQVWMGRFGKIFLMLSIMLSGLYFLFVFRNDGELLVRIKTLYSIQTHLLITSCLIFPLFLMVLGWFWNQYINITVLLQYRDAKKKLDKQFKLILINSLLFVALMNLPFFLLSIGLVIYEQSFSFFIFILLSICIQIIGFNLIGNLQLLIQLKSSNSIISFLVVIAFLQIPEVIGDILHLPIYSMSNYIYLNNWLLPDAYMFSNLMAILVISLFWLLILCILKLVNHRRGGVCK